MAGHSRGGCANCDLIGFTVYLILGSWFHCLMYGCRCALTLDVCHLLEPVTSVDTSAHATVRAMCCFMSSQ